MWTNHSEWVDCEIQVAAKKWLFYSILFNSINVLYSCCDIRSKLLKWQFRWIYVTSSLANSTKRIFVNKFLPLSYHCSHFLATTCISQLFHFAQLWISRYFINWIKLLFFSVAGKRARGKKKSFVQLSLANRIKVTSNGDTAITSFAFVC